MSDGGAGLYLYGVIRGGHGLVLDTPPITGEGPVYAIAHGGLVAVVSDSPLARYELTRHNVRGHQAVVDEVMRTHDILPARLGTVLPSAHAVFEDLLTERRADLERLLERIAGRVELGLKASWTDLQRVFREIVAAGHDLRAFRDRLARSPGAATYELRLELGRRAARALEAKRQREAKELVGAVQPQAVMVRRNEPITEPMVLNAAFLVDRGRVEAFEAAVRRLDRLNGDRLDLLLAGPLAPYNFVDGATYEGKRASERKGGG